MTDTAPKTETPADEPDPAETTDCEFVEQPPEDGFVVKSTDTWGVLVAAHGEDVAERNGMTFHTPLVTGTILN